MKYELILKIKLHEHDSFNVYRRCVCEDTRYDYVLSQFKDYCKNICDHVRCYDTVLLVNKLDDNKNFVEVVL